MERLLITKNGALYSSTIAGASANSLTTRDQLDVLQPGGIVWFEKGGTRGTAAGGYTKTVGETHGVFALGLPTGYETRVSPLVSLSNMIYTKKAAVAAAAQVGVLGDDGVTVRTSGAFATADIGTEFVCTVVSGGSGDFRATALALLNIKSTGLDLAADTDLVLGEIYTVIAAGTPDLWDSGELTSTLVGTLTIGTKAVGASYGLWITDLDKETWERRTYDVSLTLTDASMSDAAMLAALVVAFNVHVKASLIATAAVTTGDAGISFTSVTAGGKFTVLPQGLLYGSTFAKDGTGLSQVVILGEGTNAQIVDLEAKCIGIEGATGTHSNDQMGDVWKVPSLVESALTYVQYVLEWDDQRTTAYVSNNGNPQFKKITIAVPTADTTMVTAMDNLLADIGTIRV